MNRSYAQDFKEFENQVKAFFKAKKFLSADVLVSILDPKNYDFSMFTGIDVTEVDPSRLYFVTFINVKDDSGKIFQDFWSLSSSADVSLNACQEKFLATTEKL